MQSHKIAKSLTFKENQAYLGAYDFYRFAIPAAIIISLAAHVVSMVSQSEPKDRQTLTVFEIILFGAILIGSYIAAFKFYIQCNRIDTTPVFYNNIPLKQQQTVSELQLQDNLLGSKKPKRNFCSICKIFCEYRTRHCRKCQVCIERYDHHCFWIGNCVGRHNHRQFYLFLLAQTINNVFLFLIIYAIPQQSGWRYWIKLAGELLSLGFCAFTGYLLAYHTMLVSCGITTWEHMRRGKITYLKYLPPGHNPFSRGILQNWQIFMSQPTRACGSQQIQAWQQQIVSFDDAKSLKPSFNLIQNQYYSCC